jgi:hypothetical protein
VNDHNNDKLWKKFYCNFYIHDKAGVKKKKKEKNLEESLRKLKIRENI